MNNLEAMELLNNTIEAQRDEILELPRRDGEVSRSAVQQYLTYRMDIDHDILDAITNPNTFNTTYGGDDVWSRCKMAVCDELFDLYLI